MAGAAAIGQAMRRWYRRHHRMAARQPENAARWVKYLSGSKCQLNRLCEVVSK